MTTFGTLYLNLAGDCPPAPHPARSGACPPHAEAITFLALADPGAVGVLLAVVRVIERRT